LSFSFVFCLFERKREKEMDKNYEKHLNDLQNHLGRKGSKDLVDTFLDFRHDYVRLRNTCRRWEGKYDEMEKSKEYYKRKYEETLWKLRREEQRMKDIREALEDAYDWMA